MKVVSKIILEICIDNFEDAIKAIDNGATRLECCSALHEDGLTPDINMVQKIMAYNDIPLRVMIRPRGGDFCYSNQEIEQMTQDIKRFKKLKIDGLVWGCLLPTGQVDRYCCEQLIAASESLAITFHRAFDGIKDKTRALQQLKEMGIDSILTAGGKGNAANNIDELSSLVSKANDEIKIIAGGGVMPENAKEIIKSQVHGIHASLNTQTVSYESNEKIRQLKSIL